MATSLERLQPHSTAIIQAHKASNSENFAIIGRVQLFLKQKYHSQLSAQND